jgi:Baseplate J-like protein
MGNLMASLTGHTIDSARSVTKTIQYRAAHEQRRIIVRDRRNNEGEPILNGIDYVEVSPDRTTVFVYFIHPLTITLTLDNIQITRTEATSLATSLEPDRIDVRSLSVFNQRLTIGVLPPQDLFTYRIALVETYNFAKSQATPQPPEGIDPKLAQVDFVFQVGEGRDIDCQSPGPAQAKREPAPQIDYLAKDYGSFRQLMLDRLAVTLPQWQERSPADIGMVMVEVLAYVGDYLSYYQDAVATEAYLGTARKRMSVRRHARLLNYDMHDGCNSRAWVTIQVSDRANGVVLPGPGDRPTRFLTRSRLFPPQLTAVQYQEAVTDMAVVFEPLHDLELHHACNQISIYPWGESEYSLAIGSTHATLMDEHQILQQHLVPGMVLILEEVGIHQGDFQIDANPNHRHTILLTKITASEDPLFQKNVVEIEWAQADALPFELVISTVIRNRTFGDFSLVRGNVVLVDYGRTVEQPYDRELPPIPDNGRYRPRLRQPHLIQQGRIQHSRLGSVPVNLQPLRDRRNPDDLDPQVSAKNALCWDTHQAMPAIVLQEFDAKNVQTGTWVPRRELLNSDRFAREFVVEPEDEGRAELRFGDGELGRKPQADKTLKALYRVGNGSLGNVGADSISHLYSEDSNLFGILAEVANPIRNPIPATGGQRAEPIEQVRLNAPQGFRTLQRAVTEADYAELAQQFPTVVRALATRRWTGSWYTLFITIDRQGGLAIDETFKNNLLAFLEPFRLTGHDLEIESPQFVALDIALSISVIPTYFANQVKQALESAFSSQVRSNGELGFFHSDRFTFGQPVYVSQVIATAMAVSGVQSVRVDRFQRLGMPPQKELELGRICFGRLEIAQLETSMGRTDRGKIEFLMEGGL